MSPVDSWPAERPGRRYFKSYGRATDGKCHRHRVASLPGERPASEAEWCHESGGRMAR
jgi:hypothetical protein